MGIMGSQHRGLGYQSGRSSVSQTGVGTINFVKSKSNHEAESFKLELVDQKEKQVYDCKIKQVHKCNTMQHKNSEIHKIWTKSKRGRRVFECFHCEKACHIRLFCYKFKNIIKQLWKSEKCFIE